VKYNALRIEDFHLPAEGMLQFFPAQMHQHFIGKKPMTTADLDNLTDPDILASEIIEYIESGLNSFKEIMETINGNAEE
jgi:hypothetical protein